MQLYVYDDALAKYRPVRIARVNWQSVPPRVQYAVAYTDLAKDAELAEADDDQDTDEDLTSPVLSPYRIEFERWPGLWVLYATAIDPVSAWRMLKITLDNFPELPIRVTGPEVYLLCRATSQPPERANDG